MDIMPLPWRVAPQRRLRGFTLIELLITVAVVAILARVALPAYFDTIRKSRRSDAVAAIAQAQQAQERYRANNSQYGDRFAIATSGGGLSAVALSTDTAPTGTTLNANYTTSSGYYQLSLPSVTPTDTGFKYIVLATAQGSQANDTNCKYMQVTQEKGNTTYASGSTSSVANGASVNNQCWKR